MQLPEEIYGWLVGTKMIANEGELDEHRKVTLPAAVSNNLENGFIIGEVIRRIITHSKAKVPSALLNVKSDYSKNTKLTNWNFIWLTFDSIGIKLENRIKQLILSGENALIVEVLRQLQQLEPEKNEYSQLPIRQKTTSNPRRTGSQAVDVKKINLNKDPLESESSLQFLILLLKASLGMSLEQILGLFTNQNKLLSQIIVRGVNDNYEPIILFYSLLNKHAQKFRNFQELDSRDAEACLFAIQTGFISKNEKVAQLTIDLFGKMHNIYKWFISEEGKCSGTLLLGIKRHVQLRDHFWKLLLSIIKGEEVEYFTTHYGPSFQEPSQQIQITTLILKSISQCFLGQLLTSLGVIVTWIEVAAQLPQAQIASQEINIGFLGQILLYFPTLIEQNEEFLGVLGKNWEKHTLCQFVSLATQVIGVLEKLAAAKSIMARRVYDIIAEISKKIGPGDKRQYLIENFILLLRKFTNIPSQQLLKSVESNSLTNSEYMLVCQTIEVSTDFTTLLSSGNKLKALFIDNPLLNFYIINLLKEISHKIYNSQTQRGMKFIENLTEDTLNRYSVLFLKYKPKPKQQNSMYFGKSGSPAKVSKSQEEQIHLKQKWRQLYFKLIKGLTDLAFTEDSEQLKLMIKEKLLNCNSKIRLNNFKIASKDIQDILLNRFDVQREDQLQHLQQFKTKQEQNLSDSMIHRSKAQSQATLVSTRLKGPQHLTKQFQSIVDKRKAEQEERQALQIKKQLLEQKRKISVRKELQISNLLRGQIGEAQLREQGFFHRLIQYSKQYELAMFEQLEQTQIQAIDSLLKRYHRVLRHVFLNYSATMYSNHNIQTIHDNIKRKQTLTAVELAKFLKDYGFFGNTSQPEVSSIVRDINVKILNRREVNQLDFSGFEQFLIQFCFNNRAKTTSHHKTPTVADTQPKPNFSLPVYSNLRQFLIDLKAAFIQLGQKVTVFQHLEDIPLSKEQAYTIGILNQKVMQNENYILPAGYKKIAEKSMKFHYKTSPYIEGLYEQYSVAYEVLEDILFRQFGFHILEPYSQKATTYKVKPILPTTSDQVLQRQRASSTTILKKTPFLGQQQKKRSSSRQVLDVLKHVPKDLAASQPTKKIDEQVVKKVDDLKLVQKQKEVKQLEQKKKAEREAKGAQLIKAKLERADHKDKQKETEKEKQLRKQKSEERRRRQQTQKFLQEQNFKQRQKKMQQQEEERRKRQKQAQEREQQIKENKEKFKILHQAQIQKIKRIQLQASQKIKRHEQLETQNHQKVEQQRRKLRQQIQEQDKSIIQTRKQVQTQLTQLFQSQPIVEIFKTYQNNLQGLFQFLLARTHYSLTQKRHNNEIIYDVWKYFLSAFEVSPLILNPKEAVSIFKSLTKDKIAPKEYIVGLSYEEFQQALLRIAVKHKTIFNIINSKIIDEIKPTSLPQNQSQKKNPPNAKNSKEALKKSTKQAASKLQAEKPSNQSNVQKQLEIKQVLKADNADKDEINEYGDISKASDKTLRGLIYYLRVPNNKQGQETRFREILSQKQSGAVHNSDKLKQKLQSAYTLQSAKNKQKADSSKIQQSKPI